MTDQAAADSTAVAQAIFGAHIAGPDPSRDYWIQLADAAISALAARGISREAMQRREDDWFRVNEARLDFKIKWDEAREETARLRAALERLESELASIPESKQDPWAIYEKCKKMAREALEGKGAA